MGRAREKTAVVMGPLGFLATTALAAAAGPAIVAAFLASLLYAADWLGMVPPRHVPDPDKEPD